MRRRFVIIGLVLLVSMATFGVWLTYYYTISESFPFSGSVNSTYLAYSRTIKSVSRGVELSVSCSSNSSVTVAITSLANYQEVNRTRDLKKLVPYVSKTGSSVSVSWVVDHTDDYVAVVAYSDRPASFSATLTASAHPFAVYGYYATAIGAIIGGAMILFGVFSKPPKPLEPKKAEKPKKA